jgi:ribonuclease HII
MEFHEEELKVLERGGVIIGVDEVGRGSLAGPICVSACVITPMSHTTFSSRDVKKTPIRDSKRLSRAQRERTFSWLQENVQATFVQIEASEIDEHGIQKANVKALRMALEQASLLQETQDVVAFVDHFKVQTLPRISRIISSPKGDSLYISVACASIWAKVTRDIHMAQLAIEHPNYGWEKNAGYGTLKHQEALKEFGISPQHRKSFLTKMQSFYSKEA